MFDFDQEQLKRHAEAEAAFGDVTFNLRGEVFYVRPTVAYRAIKRMAEIADGTSGVEVFDRVEKAVLAMIDPRDDAHERFLRVCDNTEHPVTVEDLNQINSWLIEETTGRPPTPQPSSATGPSTAGTSSTVSSSSERVVA